MAIDKAFVISTPSNKTSIWSELCGDDISAVDNNDVETLRKYIVDKEVIRDREPFSVTVKVAESNNPNWLLTFADLNNVTDETRNTNQTKEIKMTNVLSIETGATLINGKPSSNFTEDQIINMITCENEKIKTFESVTTQSVNINNKVEACKDNIGLLIAILDEDEEIIE